MVTVVMATVAPADPHVMGTVMVNKPSSKGTSALCKVPFDFLIYADCIV